MTQAELRLIRILGAPIEDVFEAWTNPAIMMNWFFAGESWSVDVENEPKVGGAFSLGMVSDTGERFLCTGVYREIRPPTRLVFTWTSYAVSDTLVTIELRDLGDGKTELTLIHDGLIDPPVRQNHSEGWGGCLANLEKMLIRGTA